MIRKLLKVEFRESLSSMLPVGVGMVVLSALMALTSVLTGRLDLNFGKFDWFNALLSFATGICFLAVLVVCFCANVGRFYRMLGEEGYIQLTLPATLSQHIAAKLIAAVATTLLSFLFLAACIFLMSLPTSINAFIAALREGYDTIRGLGLPACLLLLLFTVLSIAAIYLHTYLSSAIGGLFTQQRKLASIITFFALQFLAQILTMLVIYFAATHMQTFIDNLGRFAFNLLSSPNGSLKAFYGSLIGVSAVTAVIDAVLWLITQTILTRKLNLP